MARLQPLTQPHDLPGPYGPPLIGHLFQLSSERSHLTLERWAERYGPLFQIRLGRSRLVVVSDHGAIQRILEQRPQSFRRNRVIEDRFTEIGIDGSSRRRGKIGVSRDAPWWLPSAAHGSPTSSPNSKPQQLVCSDDGRRRQTGINLWTSAVT